MGEKSATWAYLTRASASGVEGFTVTTVFEVAVST